MSQGQLTLREIWEQHCKAHKLTPGQAANVLLNYIILRMMFPEVSLAFYLDRYRVLAGADKDNRQFPKDALDHHCPSKGGAWPPPARVEVMLRYVEVLDLLAATNQAVIGFDQFLSTEAPVVAEAGVGVLPAAVQQPAMSTEPLREMTLEEMQANEPPPKAAPLEPRPPVTVPPVTAPATAPVQPPAAAPQPINLQVGLGTYTTNQVQADVPVVENGFIYTVYEVDGRALAGFVTAEGTLREDAEVERCQTLGPPPEPLAKIKLSSADYGEAMRFLESPGPVGTMEIGAPLIDWDVALGGDFVALIQVYNAQPRPRVRSYLLRAGQPVAELRPRQALLGYYPLVYQNQVYVVEVSPPRGA